MGKGHERSGISELTRMRERLLKEMKRQINYLRSDLACVSPDSETFLMISYFLKDHNIALFAVVCLAVSSSNPIVIFCVDTLTNFF